MVMKVTPFEAEFTLAERLEVTKFHQQDPLHSPIDVFMESVVLAAVGWQLSCG
jgi:hypothetical protein